jgi:hypothetical protein
MNKAFVREPDQETRVFCPQCGSVGTQVGAITLDRHVRPEVRMRLKQEAWYCSSGNCTTAYFNHLGVTVLISELQTTVYPHDSAASLCACFPFAFDQIIADADDRSPLRIRELYRLSQTPDARCGELAIDGQCCMKEIQRHYFRLLSSAPPL